MLLKTSPCSPIDFIVKGTEGAIAAKTVSYDFERRVAPVDLLS
ncbi:hypothetical protein XBKQ1_1590004 [Xenorhabdus bovienii str. kraussei Quebec]|uniref:Uncharacterized protein n=2 Tax=Xenorhabdus bovienii TaxID=40576 RepID=A0A077PE19_XENBV|nr:hypothetical protein XBKQ1_1590004 [Xenorhabdus bovienii str. kraussei Quebec]CDH35120.1 hypothetical protein XBI1_840030 [Xenorhabdus bovienii str. Intermedium]